MSTDFRAAIGATRAPLVHPEGEGLGLAEIDELCAEFGFHYDDDQGETLEILQEMIAAALSRWGRPTAPPAPKSRNPTMDEVMDMARSFQLEVSDRGALLWLVITAIAVWGDASATPPAPEAGELGEVVEWLESQAAHLRKMQEIGALPETELQEMLDRAATLLQQQQYLLGLAGEELDRMMGQQSAPAPAVVPVAWCRSDEFTNSMKRGGSFNGWKDPGAGTDKCDMQLYAIPLPQAGEVDG